MNNYDQFVKHWGNHSKDKVFQQCSGYFGDGVSHQKSEDELKRLEQDSFRSLLKKAEQLDFPIYITQTGGWHWCICDERNLFGNEIGSFAELEQFGKDYVYQ